MTPKLKLTTFFIALSVFAFSCKEKSITNNEVEKTQTPASKPEEKAPEVPKVKEEEKPAYTYSIVSRKDWFKANDSLLNDSSRQILADVNRVDKQHLNYQDSIVMPSDLTGSRRDYLPFPINVEGLADIDKIIFFSYPTQTFAAYNNGILTLTGPTNMGRKNKPTPTGLFFTNWKAKETISTVNDEWKLKWNFNVANFDGVGFHEYALPGYPASHSCLRLQSNDAQFLYSWANQWVLKNGKIEIPGTPVIIFGVYPFGKTKPWKTLVTDGKALDISRDELLKLVDPVKEKIMQVQQQRETYNASRDTTAKA